MKRKTKGKLDCKELDKGLRMNEHTLDALVTPGHYKIESCDVTTSEGFPEEISKGRLSAYLEVTSTNHSSDRLKDNAIGQVLTVTDSNGVTNIYTRNRTNSNAAYIWSEWSGVGGKSAGDIMDGAITKSKLSTDIRNELNKIVELEKWNLIYPKNLFNPEDIEDGFIDTGSGTVLVSSNYPKAKVSGYIDVEPLKTYYLSGRNDVRSVVGYDHEGNKVKVSGNGTWNLNDYNGAFTVPDNVVKVRFTLTLNLDEIPALIQFEEGEQKTAYEPYSEPQILNTVVQNNSADIENLHNKINTVSIVKSKLFTNEIISPSYYFPEKTSFIVGNFNSWIGFSRVEDLPQDGILKTIKFAGAASVDYLFPARISKKVRNENGVITALETVLEFNIVLTNGSSEIDVYNLNIEFKRDYVLELYYGYFPTGIIKYITGAANGVNCVIYKEQVATTGSMWSVDVLIATLESSQRKKEIKVLSIGNSFADDAFSYSPYILQNIAPEVNLTLGVSYYGGCSLEQHLSFLNDENSVYSFHLWDYKTNVWYNSANVTLQSCIKAYEWDIIVFQQNGKNTIDYSTISPYLNPLIKSIYPLLRKPVKLAWLLTPAYQSNYEESVTHYNNTAKVVEQIFDNSPIELLFPCGTAIQNVRTTSLRSLGDNGNLICDSHLQEGLPCQIEAYVAAMIIARSTGNEFSSVYGDSIRVTTQWVSGKNIQGANGTPVGSTDENCLIAQVAAIAAIKNPLEITDVSYLEE